MSRVDSLEGSKRSPMSKAEQNTMVIGVGGAGNDLIAHLMDSSTTGIHCLAVDTDPYHLQITQAHSKLFVPQEKDSATSGDIEAGSRVGYEATKMLDHSLAGHDIIFVLAGMGGRTATGAAPILAQHARKNGSLVIGLVTHPFPFNPERFPVAIQGIRSMLNACHTVVILDAQPSLSSSYTLPIQLTHDSPAQMCCRLVSSITHGFEPGALSGEELNRLRNILASGGLARAAISESYSPWGAEEAVLAAVRTALPMGGLSNARGVYAHIVSDQALPHQHFRSAIELLNCKVNPEAQFVYVKHSEPGAHGITKVNLIVTGIQFPYMWGGHRKLPLHLHELEPDAGEDQSIGISFGLDQLEEIVA